MTKGLKILAVDDDAFMLEILSSSIETLGYNDVTTVASAFDALHALRKTRRPFDLFLVDIQMPGMDGIELCSRIRSTNGYQRTPIIMATAMQEQDYVNRAFAAGATDYVTKPFEIVELHARISMAERLVDEMRRSSASSRTLEALTRQITSDHKPPLEAAISIDDVDHYLPFATFRNYVGQLQRGKYYTTAFRAVMVRNIEQFHRACSAVEFEHLISDICDSISSNLFSGDAFFTYAGSGVFVLSYKRGSSAISEDFVLMVEDTLAQYGVTYGGIRVDSIRLTRGDEKSPSVFSKEGSEKLIDSAVRSVVSINSTLRTRSANQKVTRSALGSKW